MSTTQRTRCWAAVRDLIAITISLHKKPCLSIVFIVLCLVFAKHIVENNNHLVRSCLIQKISKNLYIFVKKEIFFCVEKGVLLKADRL